ncbi:uncharacterized protein AB675_277 [Cyphellophora attinorum]|uniref:Uncharacterized protein n=1 Tax=Cyphellophora attinorum TaxID=1664694 RepID=A0A0N0NS55_9EURO|nr:uncharacterized protein AB675_277 [Phialophora attinorum]KPI45609.1 hypothetical protein AB675_277 [Phialophora attinorum]
MTAPSRSLRPIQKRTVVLEARQSSPPRDGNGGGGGGSNTILIIWFPKGPLLICLSPGRGSSRRPYHYPHPNVDIPPPQTCPGSDTVDHPGFLKKRWEAWKPREKYSSLNNSTRTSLNVNTTYSAHETEERAATNAAAAGVDRNTSVRSVMTLPAYSHSPRDEEQVLGREGEREGMDTVVEFPETHDEEEIRREEQMESLYQIRLQRRREIAEREARRQERREAREAGDTARLEQLRRDSRARANNQSTNSLNGGLSVSAATMVAEHQSRSRDRRTSSVAYANVGQVRHDGTRIRANSSESERGGLLDNAAPMGDDGNSLHPSMTTGRPSTGRERSGSSALSISTMASDVERGDASSHRHTSSDDTTSDSSPTATRFTPEGSTEGENDIGEARIPPPSTSITTTDIANNNTDSPMSPPPGWEAPQDWGDAPAYQERMASLRRQATGPNRTNSQRAFDEMSRASTIEPAGAASGSAPQLPALVNLPSISVVGASLPGSPVSPLEGDSGRSSRSPVGRSRMGGNEEFMS